MKRRIPSLLFGPLLALSCAAAHAASSAQAITPLNQNVAGGESLVFSARFVDALGHPVAGEAVQFSNDACGIFPNGQPVITVNADGNGVASTTFTAFNQGITCRLVASAGARVQWNVLTYLPAYAYLAARIPSNVPPGQPFMVTGAAMYGAYSLFDADIAARIVPGSASASISPGSANTGQAGSATFMVTPDARIGDYAIELRFRGLTQRFDIPAPPAPWQDMWWSGAAENGWGMSVIQHRDVLFAVIYAYDASGSPTWYVLPGGAWNDARTAFSGALYRPTGSPYSTYDAARFHAGEPVGSASFTIVDAGHGTLQYTIDGVAGRKDVSRQAFGPSDATPSVALGDMWWGGEAQDGWGIAVLQQYRTLFSVWFTYDGNGAPTWFVMPSGYWSDAQTWQGRIYRTSGSPWLGQAYDPAALRLSDVGAFRLRFDGGGDATLDYAIDGRSGSLVLARQPF